MIYKSSRHRSLFSHRRSSRPARPRKEKRRFSVAGFVGRLARRMLLTLGVCFLLIIVSSAVLTWRIGAAMDVKLPETFVLYLPLSSGFLEHENTGSVFSFGSDEPVLRDVIFALEEGAKDDRVKGLVVNLKTGGAGLSLAHVQELAAAITAFRDTGRWTYIYAPSYGDPNGGLAAYYLASAFQDIWLQPMGTLTLSGIQAEVPFARAALDKMGVTPQFYTRKEYKSVFESFTHAEMTEDNKTMLTALLGDITVRLVEGIVRHTGQTQATVLRHINTGFFTDEDALESRLVTRIDDSGALQEELADLLEIDRSQDDFLVYAVHYAQNKNLRIQPAKKTGGISAPKIVKPTPPTDKDAAEKPKVALIYVSGTIVPTSDSPDSGFGGESLATADTIVADIDEALLDSDVQGLVVRIDSPGGSPVASEAIRRALVRAQAKGLPVIVSMGSVAASGGYWIASTADRIFALPSTLTGSIGVAGGKFVLEDLWSKLGIHWDTIRFGKHAGMWSFNEPFSPDNEVIVNRMMDSVYDGFIARVAEGRNMTPEAADEVARGRVWSGHQAREVGLVDTLGGLNDAFDYIAQELGVGTRQDIQVEIYPVPKTFFDILGEIMFGQVYMADTLRTLSPALATLQKAAVLEGGARYQTYMPLRIE